MFVCVSLSQLPKTRTRVQRGFLLKDEVPVVVLWLVECRWLRARGRRWKGRW